MAGLFKKELCEHEFVGNKAKGRISKRVFQESKARQNFRKKKFFRPFALLPTSCKNHFKLQNSNTVSWLKIQVDSVFTYSLNSQYCLRKLNEKSGKTGV